MRKIIMLLSSVGFLSTSTLNVVACGVQNGDAIKYIADAPTKAKDSEDPLTSYVYNDQYLYGDTAVVNLLGVGGQLAADKIRDDNGTTLNSDTWQQFYQSDAYKVDSYTTFGLDPTDYDTTNREFSYKGANGSDLFYGMINDNDAHLDKNKLRVYWYTFNSTPWVKGDATFKPKADNLVVPKLSDFDAKQTPIVRQLYLHMYILNPGFRIDFSLKVDITFQVVVDKNNLSIVTLADNTLAKPCGDIIWDNPAPVYRDRIANLTIATN